MKSILCTILPFCILDVSTAFGTNQFFLDNKASIQTQILSKPSSVDEANNDSRRTFLTAGLTYTFAAIANPAVSNARYGDSPMIELPDIVGDLADRQNKQCLVESLGNRACLVYMDPENQLYKGSENEILLERLGKLVTALEDLPQYIESKQWNAVLGVLTGPMGTLSSTMNELTKNVEDNGKKNKIKALSTAVRQDLYAISAAVDRKNAKDAMSAYEKAAVKLDQFVLSVR